jgi:hypothetical protein
MKTEREFCTLCDRFIDLGPHRVERIKGGRAVVTEFGLPNVTHIILQGVPRERKLKSLGDSAT